jgi:hypothetical protein
VLPRWSCRHELQRLQAQQRSRRLLRLRLLRLRLRLVSLLLAPAPPLLQLPASPHPLRTRFLEALLLRLGAVACNDPRCPLAIVPAYNRRRWTLPQVAVRPSSISNCRFAPTPIAPCCVAWTRFLSAAVTVAPIGSRCVRVDRDLINETSARQRCLNAKTPLRCLNIKTPLRWPAGAAHTPPLRQPRLCVSRLYRPFPGGLFVVVAQRPRIAQLWECTVHEFLR